MEIFSGINSNSKRLQGFRNGGIYQSFPKVLFITVSKGWDQKTFFPMNTKLFHEEQIPTKTAAYTALDDETSFPIPICKERKTKTWYSKLSNLARDLETYPSINSHFAFRKCYFV